MYRLPDQVLYRYAADEKTDEEQTKYHNAAPRPADEAAQRGAKRYVFQPEESGQVPLSDEDLTFNDPLNPN